MQRVWKKRLLLSVPLLGIGALICQIDYSIIWRYFSWANQTLAMIALWAAAMYLVEHKRNHWICTIPATFMSAVSMTYFIAAPECMGLLWTPMGRLMWFTTPSLWWAAQHLLFCSWASS